MTGTHPGVSDTVPGREDGACGYPGTSANDAVTNPTNLVAPTGDVTSFTGAQPANADSNGDPADQYVAKHFPTPWFASLTGESAGTQSGVTYTRPDGAQPADDAGVRRPGRTDDRLDRLQLRRQPRRQPRRPDLRPGPRPELPANQVPAFNWITPNNCSDAHDATCQGNNLSGCVQRRRLTRTTRPAGLPAYDPEATTPTNYTGGLYASDLFLRYYIPLIEQSAAFADGGLIDVTFDEANPPFTTRQQLQQRAGIG